MATFLRLGILLVLFSAASQAQLPLRVKEKVPVPSVSLNLMIAPFACDSSGSVFLRPYAGELLTAKLLKISADGKKTTDLNVNSVPGFEHSPISAFSISPEDDVYIATGKPPNDIYLLRFDKDGQYRAAINLDFDVPTAVTQLVALNSKSFFVGGTTIAKQKNPTMFAGFFDDNGRMVAKIAFPAARNPRNKVTGESPQPTHTSKSRLEEIQAALDTIGLSLAESGGDGRVYFVRHAVAGPAYVVSADGEVIKEIPLNTPKEPGFELSGAKAAGGRLAVLYEGHPPPGGTSPIRIFVYDVQSGKKVASYFHQDFEVGDALACYSNDDTFTFISSDESGRMILVRASAR
jgi:hypothetical protein